MPDCVSLEDANKMIIVLAGLFKIKVDGHTFAGPFGTDLLPTNCHATAGVGKDGQPAVRLTVPVWSALLLELLESGHPLVLVLGGASG